MNTRDFRRTTIHILALATLLVSSFASTAGLAPALASHTLAPTSVTIAGSLQSELGCSGDWQPECSATHLAYDANDDVWQASWDVPAGGWEYKAALNGNWTENYGLHAAPGGSNIPLVLSGSASVKFYYDHKTHWVTDNKNSIIVTAPGSFQSELGCSGDWDPGCLRSWLQDPDGDGIYTLQATGLPAGNYEFKVAIAESWSENYGAGGAPGGANIPFTISKPGDELTISWNSTTHVPSVFVDAGSQPEDPGLVQPSLQNPAQDLTFYFVLPDRFENGSTSNDRGGYSPDNRLATGFDPTDKGFYHGGDLRGLINKLDYIQGLGVNAIWMAPIFKNKPVQGAGADVSAGYHGYWITDFTQVDPHFGTNDELREMVQKAHARGIKVFFDIITNHTADVIQYQEGKYTYRNKTTYPYKDANGIIFDDRAFVGTGTFPALSADNFPYTPIFPNSDDATVKKPDWLNDPTVYHNRGNTTYTGEDSTYGDFSGLDDLFTEQPRVVSGMTQIFKDWITNFKIDGFRIDTVKHVNLEFWQQFAPEILAHARSQGINDFYMFGEVFDSDPANTSVFTTKGKLPAVLDFGFQSQARAFASQGAGTNSLRDFFASDDYYTDADSNAYELPTFLGNHDMGRFGYFLRSDQPSASASELLARDKLGNGLMFFSRGVPVIYYGDEQGFTGDGGDKDARQDMFASQVASYNDDVLIGTSASGSIPHFDTTQPLYQTIKLYSDLRQANVALRRGAQIHRYSEAGPGIYAFSRMDSQERVEYVVALNNATATKTASFSTYQPNVAFTAIYTANDTTVPPVATTTADKQIAVSVPPLSFVIYRAGAPVPPASAAPRISITNPASDSVVRGQVQLAASLASDSPAKVTFAVKESSAPTTTYAAIGADNNAPYSIYYDVSAWPVSTTLTFKAIVSDSGNLKSTTVDVVVGAPETPSAAGNLEYTFIHYQRPAGDYDGWGLHLWGDGLDPAEGTTWTTPKPFEGETSFGRFAFIKLKNDAKAVNFIVHKGDVKDTPDDRLYVPGVTPEIWLKQDDATIYPSQAAAQGFVTIHYRRTLGDYDNWGLHLWGDAIAPPEGTSWDAPKQRSGVDDFGAFYTIAIQDATKPVNFIVHTPSGDSVPDTREPGGDRSFIPAKTADIWLMQGDAKVYASRGAAENYALLHYHRTAGDYGDPASSDYQDFWGLHTWGGAADPGWTTPRKPAGQDAFGIYFKVPLDAGANGVSYILHRGDTKDPGPDQRFDIVKYGNEAWQIQGRGEFIRPILGAGGGGGDLSLYKAHWVTRNIIAWKIDPTLKDHVLYHAPNGGMALGPNGITGGQPITLTYNGALSNWLVQKYPQLEGYSEFRITGADLNQVPALLKGQLAVAAFNSKGIMMDATGLQIPGVLDDLYTYTGTLGIVYSHRVPGLKLWAPTARNVTLHLFTDSVSTTTSITHPMSYDAATGVWNITGDASWTGKFYLYEVEVYVHSTGKVEHNLVTDPYAVSLSTNSKRSQIVDLDSPGLKPMGWGLPFKPPLRAPEDISIYELHVRDFSINDASVPPNYRGTFKAFTVRNSNGMRHLADLAGAGLTHLHILPAFDFATVNENKAERVEPDPAILATFPPSSTLQQSLIYPLRDQDGFNWGYDPLHYSVPEGSYSTNPDGSTRILEFRQMVQAVNRTGLRLVMDVVYNHTSASGQAPNSILDKVVPGYYHRLDENGNVTTSTCCANTATEHAMMEKLMVDSIVQWAKDYKVDGFRFDLMGHHMKSNMLHVRQALDALTLFKDGVDGSKIYLYGEGWNFGEVANNARGVNATQLNMAGTGIGTFSDRLRDAVRGGGPFDNGNDMVRNQGFISGLYYDPNALNSGSQAEKDRLLLYADQIKVGLAGNLAGYTFTNRLGQVVSGSQVDYNGQPAGYTADPQENIVYIEAHDNQTLYDVTQYKMPASATMSDRVRAHNVGLSIVSLAQGVPFFHAGSDMLRSKSLDPNSYNSGDWFNKLDFTYQSNNWGVGLPVNQSGNWSIMEPLLANPALKPSRTDILNSVHYLQEMMEIRQSSSLFRLRTAAEVQSKLKFLNTGPNQIPGLIVMVLADTDGSRIVVLFNANDQAQTFSESSLAGLRFMLHPVQTWGHDPVVKTSAYNNASGTFTVPGRTTAVFVRQCRSQWLPWGEFKGAGPMDCR